MAVTVFTEKWRGDVSSQDVAVREYRRIFRARTDSNADRAHNVTSFANCPQVGTAYPGNPAALCKTVVAEHEGDDPYEYVVTADYDDLGVSFSPDNPLLAPPERHVRFAIRREPFEKDAEDNPVVNSAKVPFSPLLERDVADMVYIVTVNSSTFPANYWATFLNKVNADIWNGFDPGKVRVVNIEADQIYKGATIYWRVTIELLIRNTALGFNVKIGDRGRTVLVPFGHPVGPRQMKRETIVGADGLPVSEDVFITPDGQSALDPDTQPITDANYKIFVPYESINFGGAIPT